MININELRVGNTIYQLLNPTDYKNPVLNSLNQVRAKVEHEVQVKTIDLESKSVNGLGIDNFSPIPLTIERIESLGFWEQNDGRYSLDLPYQLQKLEMDSDNEFWLYVAPDSEASLGIKLHLHELENLYFSITGKELGKQ
ncbi:MAG TPA: hypothetical protein VD794_11425 [Flavisolibacter sp.]|nr:hypothetical protein [Flavisolibacter sp.]